VILQVNGVTINYMMGNFKNIGLKEYVVRHLNKTYQVKMFKAVDGVSFQVDKGDMLGIVGVNGSGKSTLLKAVTGILEPQEGSVYCGGKVIALLELASGFDNDLTVRENTFLRGALLGYTRRFITEMYEEIISFAELKDFQDMLFNQLSTGMKSRLAFAIASFVKPEILLLDEVLSVGDGAFQKKSEAKMREIISGGATTILVSHSLAQVRLMCNKVLWLHKGRQMAFGETQDVCDRYQAFLDTKVLPV
jgi:ABC-2 type transport system ATP-binding protein